MGVGDLKGVVAFFAGELAVAGHNSNLFRNSPTSLNDAPRLQQPDLVACHPVLGETIRRSAGND